MLTKVGAEPVQPLHAIPAESLTIADRWILDRLDVAIAEANAALGPVRPGAGGRWTEAERTAGMRLDAYADAARRFVWNELADWYLETVKPRLSAGGTDADVARAVLVHAFDNALRLLQPVIPFITQTLWEKLPALTDGSDRGGEFLCTSAWPIAREAHHAKGDAFELVRLAVVEIRQLRNEYNVKPSRTIAVTLHTTESDERAETELAQAIGSLTRAAVTIGQIARTATGALRGNFAYIVLPAGSEAAIAIAELIGEGSAEDTAKECARLRTELATTQKLLDGVLAKLSNDSFTSRAKPDVVEGARAQQRDLSQKVDALTRKVEALCGSR